EFNTKSLLPDTASSQCVHQSDFPSEQLSAKVSKGAAYTFQIGGVTGADGVAATGQLEMLFDYLVTRTPRLQANTTLTARGTSNGISIIGLTVSSGHRGARVTVSC